MAALYRRLQRGESVAAALRGAKLASLQGTAAAGAASSTPRGVADDEDEPADSTMRRIGRRARAEFRSHPSAWAAFVPLASGR
jgi:CHAT domain-containing protein